MSHWMKVEFSTPNKPEIRAAARFCGTTRANAFLAFFEVWSYFDQNTATGFIPNLIANDLDEICHVKGFGKAMIQVGWILEDARGISVTNWERHNGKSAKARVLMEKRVQKHRAAKQWERRSVTPM